MGKFDGVLLASDFDDTLYATDKTVSPENRAALDHFTANGGRFTIATGRAHRTLAPYLSLAPVNAPVVLSNGAQLYDFARGEMVLETTLPRSIGPDLEALARELPALGVEAYHNDDVYVWNPNDFTRYHLERAGTSAAERPVGDMPQPWGKAILHQKNEILLEAQEAILKRWGDRYEAIFSNWHMLELTARGSTKGGMVLELAKRLGIARKDVYCVGDNQNDIPMLAVSAIPFAPANCAQEVKDFGAYLLRSCDESCIAQIVDILETRY